MDSHKFLGGVGLATGSNCLNFTSHPDLDLDPGMFLVFIINVQLGLEEVSTPRVPSCSLCVNGVVASSEVC